MSNCTIAIITGSPTAPSRSSALAQVVEQRLVAQGFDVHTLHVRDLPADALMRAQLEDLSIQRALALIAHAQGVVLVSPVYKASFSGLLKTFVDVLPQFGLRKKVVLPLMIGGSHAHVLALDYAVRPMLQSLDPQLTVNGLFVLDKQLLFSPQGPELSAELTARFEQTVQSFVEGLVAHHPTVAPARFDPLACSSGLAASA